MINKCKKVYKKYTFDIESKIRRTAILNKYPKLSIYPNLLFESHSLVHSCDS